MAATHTWSHTANWTERSTHWDYLTSLLVWTDQAGNSIETHPLYAPLFGSITFDGEGMIRAHKVQLFVGRIPDDTHIEYKVWFSRVGLKSYDVSHEVTRVADKTLLARITCTRVVVRNGKAATLPSVERLRQVVIPRETKLSFDASAPLRRPIDAFAYTMVVRQSDTDALGHVNNSKYMHLIEDAKAAAAKAGALPSNVAGNTTSELHIDYMNQVLAHEQLCIFVWYDQGSEVISYEFSTSSSPNVVLTRILTRVSPLQPLPKLNKPRL